MVLWFLVDDELEFNKNLYKRLLYLKWHFPVFMEDTVAVESSKLNNKEFQKSYILFHFFLFLWAYIKLEMCLYGESHAGRDNFNEVRSYVSNVIFSQHWLISLMIVSNMLLSTFLYSHRPLRY